MEISADPVIAELIIDNDDLLGMKMLHVPHSGSLLFRNIVASAARLLASDHVRSE